MAKLSKKTSSCLLYPSQKELVFDNEKENRVFAILTRLNGEVSHFISDSKIDVRRGPGDPIGTSFAFDLYDFSKRTYSYEY